VTALAHVLAHDSQALARFQRRPVPGNGPLRARLRLGALTVECAKCGHSGRYAMRRLIDGAGQSPRRGIRQHL